MSSASLLQKAKSVSKDDLLPDPTVDLAAQSHTPLFASPLTAPLVSGGLQEQTVLVSTAVAVADGEEEEKKEGEEEESTDEESIGGFNGKWNRGTIDGEKVIWHDGDETKLRITSETTCEMYFQHRLYTGELLPGGKLKWSDGDIWIRHQDTAPGPGACEDRRADCAARAAEGLCLRRAFMKTKCRKSCGICEEEREKEQEEETEGERPAVVSESAWSGFGNLKWRAPPGTECRHWCAKKAQDFCGQKCKWKKCGACPQCEVCKG